MNRLTALVLLLLAGCVTVSDGKGRRITATGDAKITLKADGTMTVENTGTAASYDAIARAAGVAAGVAASTAVKP
jgi:hypothetical protein